MKKPLKDIDKNVDDSFMDIDNIIDPNNCYLGSTVTISRQTATNVLRRGNKTVSETYQKDCACVHLSAVTLIVLLVIVSHQAYSSSQTS